FLLRSPVTGLDQVSRDVDAQHLGAEPRRRQRGRPVTEAKVEDPESLPDAEAADQRLSTLAHALGNACEVSLFPERLVRIRRRLLPRGLHDVGPLAQRSAAGRALFPNTFWLHGPGLRLADGVARVAPRCHSVRDDREGAVA